MTRPGIMSLKRAPCSGLGKWGWVASPATPRQTLSEPSFEHGVFYSFQVMSIKAIAWAFEQPLTQASHRLVLVALADFANDEGVSYPSAQTLCEMTCHKRRDTVLAILRKLVEKGLIERLERKAGTTASVHVYQFPAACCKRTEKPYASNGKRPGSVRFGENDLNSREPGTSSVPVPGATVTALIPVSLDTVEFREAWDDWLDYRRERRAVTTPQTKLAQLELLSEMGPAEAVKCIKKSITNGWQGLFPKDNQPAKFERPKNPNVKYLL